MIFYSNKASIVRLGDQNLARSDDGAEPVEYQIKKFIRHPDYHHFSRENDIAVIELKNEVNFVPNLIRPACLSQEKDYTGTVIAVSLNLNWQTRERSYLRF